MPFTLAHPAAALPLRRLGLPAAALVLGSMAPDVPLFTHRLPRYDLTHSWLGVVTVDPLLAVAAVVVWYAVVRDALVDLAPAPVRHRLADHVRLPARAWLLAPLAAAVGAATHVTWDAFTHVGRWGVALVPALDGDYGRYAGYQWAQLVSGVVGLVVVAATGTAYLVRQPVVARPRRTPPGLVWVLVAALGAAAGTAALAGLVAAAEASGGRLDMLYAAVVVGLAVLGAGAGLVCLLWRALTDPLPL